MRNAKTWAVIAVLSLAANLFLGGLLVGRSFRSDKPLPPPSVIGPIALLRSSQDLDPAARQIVENAREKHREEIHRSMMSASRSRRAAIEAVCAKDFDEAKAREAFRAYRDQTVRTHDVMHESLIDAAKQMTAEQRMVLREVLMRSGGRGGWKGRGRGVGAGFRKQVPQEALEEP